MSQNQNNQNLPKALKASPAEAYNKYAVYFK